LQLAHNERSERGVPVARMIHNFGREDQLDREALVRLVGSIQRFLGGEERLGGGDSGGVRVRGCARVWWAACRRSVVGAGGDRQGDRPRCREGPRPLGVERALFTMVCQRCLEPASKLEATRWLGREVVLDGIEAVTEDELYRAMDFLLACSERVQESVFFSLAHLLNLEVDVIFFDTSSTSFEVDVDEDAREAGEEQGGEEPLRRLGHSNDHRPDLPQVVIGLAVSREGIPLRAGSGPATPTTRRCSSR
jgi:hypothetical protein